MSAKELVNSLRRKAEQSTTRTSPPLRMDPLSLAWLYDGAQPFSLDQIAFSPPSSVQWASDDMYKVHMAQGVALEEEGEELPSFQSDL